MGIDHSGSDIAVPQQLLNAPDVLIGSQQVAGKTVAEGMCGGPLQNLRGLDCPLDRFLHMGFMQMIPPVFPGVRHQGQLFCRKKQLQ